MADSKNTKPARHRPDINAVSPRRVSPLMNMKKPKRRKSNTETKKLGQAVLLVDMKDSVLAKSRGNDEESSLDMPITKAGRSAWQELLSDGADPKCKKSETNSTSPNQIRLLTDKSKPRCTGSSTKAADSIWLVLLKDRDDSSWHPSGDGKRKPNLLTPIIEGAKSPHAKL